MDRRNVNALARAGALLLVLPLVLTSPAAGGPEPAPRPPTTDDPLGYAPDGEWPMPDGCPARTRATRTPLPAGELEVAWTWQGPAPIAGEPVVAHGRVFVGTYAGAKSVSHLDVLRVEDGAPVIPQRKFAHGLPILPTALDDVVVVPASQDTLEAFRVVPEEKRLTPLGTFPGAGERLVVDDEVVVIAGRTLERRRPGAPAARWTAELEGNPLGPPSARFGLVYVVTTREVKGYVGSQSQLETFDLETGDPHRRTLVGWDDLPAGPGRESRVVVAPGEVYVRHGVGVRLEGSAVATAVRFPLIRKELVLSDLADFLDLRLAPVVWGQESLILGPDAQGEVKLFRSDSTVAAATIGRGQWVRHVLATPARHAELLAADGVPVVAAGVALFPGGSFEVGPWRLRDLRRVSRASLRIPVRETLLEVGHDRIVAWRAKRRAPPVEGGPALPTAADAPPVAVPGAVVVTADGAVRTGDVAWDPAQQSLTLEKTKLPREEIGLVVDADGRLLHGPDPAFVVQRLHETVGPRLRAEWLALAKRAVATRAPEVLRQAIDDLAARGGQAKDLQPLRKELQKLEKPLGAPPKRDAKKIDEVAAQRRRLLAAEDDALAKAVADLPEDAPIPYRAPLLRALLARDPAHAATSAWLRSRLPAGFDPGKEAAPADWLDFVEAMAQSPLTVLPPKAEAKDLTLDDRHYGSLRTTWRKDLVALRSDRLLLVTPVARPSRIARCLSLGELVCTTLDTLFEVTPEQARVIDPLCIQLFETKEDYLRRSMQGPRHEEAGRARLVFTAGHYDSGEGLSRLYVPPGDDRFDGVMETLAHELTHHWLDQRMPPPAGTTRTSFGPATPGYFLEEGFATMVEEIVYDLDARTFSTLNPRADSLDVVASAPRLLDWAALVEMTPAGFHRLAHAEEIKVDCQWSLGYHRLLSETNLFYAQAGAICHYLWNADDGKHRTTLLEWVRDLHANRLKPGETERRLEATPAALGAAVTAWARQVTSPRK